MRKIKSQLFSFFKKKRGRERKQSDFSGLFLYIYFEEKVKYLTELLNYSQKSYPLICLEITFMAFRTIQFHIMFQAIIMTVENCTIFLEKRY